MGTGLRACMSCLRWINGSDWGLRCECEYPRPAASQHIGKALVNMRKMFPKHRLAAASVGERVDFVRATAQLFRPFSPSIADAMEAFDGTEPVSFNPTQRREIDEDET